MSFCHLTGGEKAALMFIVGAMSSPKTPPALKKLIEKKDWHTLAVILSMGTGPDVTVPSEEDIKAVGEMPTGLRNANVVLTMADAEKNEDSKKSFQNALNTHCWDKIADSLVSSMKDKTLAFTGNDLHQAYAPDDQSPCTGPGNIEIALAEMIKDGQLVASFFSNTLPDFFEHDFTNFFKDTIPDFFGGPFQEFFVDLGNNIKNSFADFGNSVKEAFESLGQKLDPTKW